MQPAASRRPGRYHSRIPCAARQWDAARKQVVIEGQCDSACTLYPDEQEHLCETRRAARLPRPARGERAEVVEKRWATDRRLALAPDQEAKNMLSRPSAVVSTHLLPLVEPEPHVCTYMYARTCTRIPPSHAKVRKGVRRSAARLKAYRTAREPIKSNLSVWINLLLRTPERTVAHAFTGPAGLSLASALNNRGNHTMRDQTPGDHVCSALCLLKNASEFPALTKRRFEYCAHVDAQLEHSCHLTKSDDRRVN